MIIYNDSKTFLKILYSKFRKMKRVELFVHRRLSDKYLIVSPSYFSYPNTFLLEYNTSNVKLFQCGGNTCLEFLVKGIIRVSRRHRVANTITHPEGAYTKVLFVRGLPLPLPTPKNSYPLWVDQMKDLSRLIAAGKYLFYNIPINSISKSAYSLKLKYAEDCMLDDPSQYIPTGNAGSVFKDYFKIGWEPLR